MIILNRKAKFQYYLLDFYTAGIQLFGSEVKSIKNKKISISESFCQMINGELYLINMYIEKYKFNFESKFSKKNSKRKIKLLLNKKELKKISKKLLNSNLTIIPIQLFFSQTRYIKIEIAIARGKKKYDKRESIKKRDSMNEMKRFFKKNYI